MERNPARPRKNNLNNPPRPRILATGSKKGGVPEDAALVIQACRMIRLAQKLSVLVIVQLRLGDIANEPSEYFSSVTL